MVQQFYLIFKTSRPRQWIKNLALFAALIFSGFLFVPGYFERVFTAFILFCGLTSAVYIINDIMDAPQDRRHPFKKKRPIASGELPIPLAWLVAILLLIGVFTVSFYLSFFFFLISFAYFLINVWYTTRLKHVAIMDVMTIAAGFILRVYAGAIVVDLHMNVWFLLTVISSSLFLAVGKRQSERTLLQGDGNLSGHRVTLATYSTRLLDIYTGMFASATWLTYSLFTFQLQFQTTEGELPILFFSRVPKAFIAQKWLMATVPLVIFGVMRYLQLVYEKNEGESPERVLLSDKPLLIAVVVWVLMVVGILYGLV
jgi:decaprenyl-phosphate phosphoribosyltransferase